MSPRRLVHVLTATAAAAHIAFRLLATPVPAPAAPAADDTRIAEQPVATVPDQRFASTRSEPVLLTP